MSEADFVEDEAEFWAAACAPSLEVVWGEPDDDVYAELLGD